MFKKTDNINFKMGNFQRIIISEWNQMEILEFKNTIAKIKFNGWIQQQDGNNKEKIDIKVSELKDRSTEIIQPEQEKRNRLKK